MKYNIFGSILPSYKDSPDKKNLKITILISLGSIIFMFLLAFIIFFLALKGPEEILVPNALVDNDGNRADLINAVKKLQEKGLYAKVQFKYSIEYQRGEVISQRPSPGSVVKQGRYIVLVVSEGSNTGSIDDYTGQTLESVEMTLKSLFINPDEAAIRIKKPVIEVYDQSPAGTILDQTPKPNTQIKDGEIVYLQFKVSKGPKGAYTVVFDYSGLGFSSDEQADFYQKIVESKLSFTFIVRDRTVNEPPGRIVAQDPAAGSEVPENTIVVLTISRPENVKAGKKFGVYEADLDTYIIKLSIELRERKKDGTENLIFSSLHYGGKIFLPYIIDNDSEAVFYVNGKEHQL